MLRCQKVVFESGDMVNLPLYWKGVVIEQFGESVVIQFSNPLFWLKRVPKHLFDYGTDERLTKKKKRLAKKLWRTILWFTQRRWFG